VVGHYEDVERRGAIRPLPGRVAKSPSHHGSLNATPKTLWNHFLHKADDSARDRLISVVSTLPGKHGSSEDHTEVPRAALVKELTAHSNFTTTQYSRKPWVDVEIPIR